MSTRLSSSKRQLGSKACRPVNAIWVHQRVTLVDTFVGGRTSRPLSHQVQAMTDLLAPFGWNAYKRRSTKSLSPTVWWILKEQAPNDESFLLAHLHSSTVRHPRSTSYLTLSAVITVATLPAQQLRMPNTAIMSCPMSRSGSNAQIVVTTLEAER